MSETVKNKKGNLLLGVIGHDAHVIGNRILEYALKKEGYNVTNLGIFVSQKEFVNSAIEADADVVLIGSLYGHAEMDCDGIKEKFIEAGLEDVLLYIGGNLVVGEKDWDTVKQTFLDLGFDRVFPPQTSPQDVAECLEEDL